MKVSLYKFAVIAVMAILVFAPALSATAQGCPSGISASDCALITAATGANAAKLSSFAMDFTVNAVANDVALSVKGNGVVDARNLDLSATDMLRQLEKLNLSAVMDVTLVDEEPAQGKVEVRVVDGQVYTKGFDGTEEWRKQPLSEVLSALSLQLGADPNGLLNLFNDPSLAETFVYTASDGPTIDGVQTRAIAATFSLEAFLESLNLPSVPEIPGVPGMPSLPGVPNPSQLFSSLGLEELLIGATNYYGVDGTFRGFKLEAVLTVGEGSMLGAAGGLELVFELDVRLSKLGEPFTVEAPIN